MSNRKPVPAATVRDWARENGLTVGERGRLSPETVTAFEKANRGKTYIPREAEGTTLSVLVMKPTASGRKVPVKRTAKIADIREWANSAGVAIGTRGRVSADVVAKYREAVLV